MRRLALLAAAFVLCGACKLSIEVGVDARADGSGTVTATVRLDEEAARRLKAVGGALEADDLRAAGWTVDKRSDRVLTASKPFSTSAELTEVIDEVAGPRRPLRDFKLTRDRSAFRTDTRFSGTVDLTAGLDVFGDDRLTEQTGTDIGTLAERGDRILDEFFDIRVAVRLPGDTESNAPTDADNGAVWQPDLGERVRLTASASELDTQRVVLVGVAATAALALLIHLVRTMRRRGQDKGSSPVH